MYKRQLSFKKNARTALLDDDLKAALSNVKEGFIGKRAAAVALVPEWQLIREEAKALKNHALENLDHYVLSYDSSVKRNGGEVHWASSSKDANDIIIDICKSVDAKTVTKGKSMVGEEADINGALKAAGLEPIETDLGEYIIQLAKEAPSHIIAPAIHKTKEQVCLLYTSPSPRD